MTNETEHIRQLLQLYVTGQATDAQLKELFLFLENPANDAVSRELFFEQVNAAEGAVTDNRSQESHEMAWNNTLAANESLRRRWQQQQARPVAAFMKWRWAAAAALLVAIAATVFVLVRRQPVPAGQTAVAYTNIPAGGSKAFLTLSDGSTIALDSTGSGAIARQGQVVIVKSAGGAVRYDAKGAGADDKPMINKIATPVGGQYRVTLPDGTGAWLNAASSITYPAVFAGAARKISVTGEVYLEVAKDMLHPFIVDVAGGSSVQVLGTSFNINAYGDEGKIRTTLISGRVKVMMNKAGSSGAILKPGQQAIENTGPGAGNVLSVVSNVNVEKETAWKDGVFYFEDAGLPEIMKQLERWYNIEVQYKGPVPALKINGKMDRNLNLQSVMDFLEKMGVSFTMNGRIMEVSSQ